MARFGGGDGSGDLSAKGGKVVNMVGTSKVVREGAERRGGVFQWIFL